MMDPSCSSALTSLLILWVTLGQLMLTKLLLVALTPIHLLTHTLLGSSSSSSSASSSSSWFRSQRILLRLHRTRARLAESAADLYDEATHLLFELTLGLYRLGASWSSQGSTFYNLNMIHVPCLKLHLWGPTTEPSAVDDDEAGREVWAIFQESIVYHSYISESLVQQLRLVTHTPTTTIMTPTTSKGVRAVRVRLRPLSDEIGLPLNLDPSEDDLYEQPDELIVLPMDQFGRVDIRVPSVKTEMIGRHQEGADIHLPPLRNEDFFAYPTADLIIGQELWIRRFLPPPDAQRVIGHQETPGNNRLAFTRARRYGDLLTGGIGCATYQDYSSYRVVFAYPVVLALVLLYLGAIHINLYLFGCKALGVIRVDSLNGAIRRATESALLLFALRALLYVGHERLKRSRPILAKGARFVQEILDQSLLWILYNLGDRERALDDLADREGGKFKRDWFHWIKRLIKETRLRPNSFEAPLLSGSPAGGGHQQSDRQQYHFLPEETRVEGGADAKNVTRKRYRPIVKALAHAGDDAMTPIEVRILVNRALDHSLVTERLLHRLTKKQQQEQSDDGSSINWSQLIPGNRLGTRRFIWPRFHWGFYPREDDMSWNYETVELVLSPRDPRQQQQKSEPAKRVELLVHRPQSPFPHHESCTPRRVYDRVLSQVGVHLTDTQEEHAHPDPHIDIVLGQDLINQVLLMDNNDGGGGKMIPLKIPGFDSALIWETRFGWTFEGFEQINGHHAHQQDRHAPSSFLGNLWSSFGGRN